MPYQRSIITWAGSSSTVRYGLEVGALPRNDDLRDIVKELLKDIPESNVVSSVHRVLIEAGLLGLKDFMPRVSKEVTITLSRRFKCENRMVESLLDNARSWVDEIVGFMSGVFRLIIVFRLTTRRRLIVHTKNPYMPLEIGILWHPILNLPYIPSSSVKGAARSYFTLSNLSPCNLALEDLFGSKNSEGSLVFLDAVPVGCQKNSSIVEADIVNPHYPEHEGRIDEASVRPTPLVYPVVPRGVTFKLVIASNSDKVAKCGELPRHLGEALEAGIGARTALSYGMIKVKPSNIIVR